MIYPEKLSRIVECVAKSSGLGMTISLFYYTAYPVNNIAAVVKGHKGAASTILLSSRAVFTPNETIVQAGGRFFPIYKNPAGAGFFCGLNN